MSDARATVDVVMPQLGETVTEGTITRWFRGEGDRIAEDEELFEVSTDKVDTTVPASVTGTVLTLLVAEGATVAVGTPIVRIVLDPGAAVPAGAVEVERAGAPVGPAAAPAGDRVDPPGAGPGGRGGQPRPAGAGEGGSAGAVVGYLSPAVRDLLDRFALDPATIVGTGGEGRITRDDVLDAVAALVRTGRPAPPSRVAVVPGARDEVVPFSPIRRRTADHMRRSLDTSAHTLVVMEVDYQGVEPVRVAHDLSYLPFIARAVVDALGQYPHVNASVVDDALVVHRDIHLGIAVDLAHQGLIVPVVHHADGLRLAALAASFGDLSRRAREHRLAAADVSGGTFTITNAGAYGTALTAPIIAQPQVAILSTDGVRMRPTAVAAADGSWGVSVHPIGNLALSFDHRAFDGAYASAFLAAVRGALQDREWEAELA